MTIPANLRIYLVLCIVILLIAGGFRWYHIADRSLWLDEARVANFARQSLADNITKTRLGSSSPIAYPLVLQAVQRVDDSVLAVRSIAAAFSLLAIIVILVLPRFGFDPSGALVSAAILAVSPSQIRYAQEVREYSLSVLLAAAMVLSLVGVLNKRNGAKALFLSTFFLAPLVQYGLVFFAIAILVTAVATGVRRDDVKPMLRIVSGAVLTLAVGVVLTYLLTLRGQWGREEFGYLSRFFFEGSIFDFGALVAFLVSRTHQMVVFLTLGQGSIVLLVPCLGFLLLARPAAPRDAKLLFGLALISIAIFAGTATLGIYPLGPIRQNLLLAPIVALAIGGGWTTLITAVPSKFRGKATPVILVLVLAAGTFGIVRADPYQEIQDIKSVIAGLDERVPGDIVYVHYGSWPAFRFYKVDGPEFVYGRSHRENPAAYLTEFRTLVGEEAPRVWVVFSHAKRKEIRFLLGGLASEWRFELVVQAPGARLYLGRRLAIGNGAGKQPGPVIP